MNKEQLEQFDEKFIYDYFDNTGLEIFGNRKENRPANDEEIKQFISTLLKAQRQEIIKKLDQLSLCMGNEWLEGERYYAVQTLIKTLINKQR